MTADVNLRLLSPRATAGIDTASGDDLANLDTSNLPNHAMAWGGDTLYQLDRSLSGTPGSGQIAPISGPGLWVAIAGGTADQLLSFDVTVPGTIDEAFLDFTSTWTALPTLAYAAQGAASILPLTLTAAGCVITNTGPAKYFLVQTCVTLIIGIDVTEFSNIGCMISVDGERITTVEAAPQCGDSRASLARGFQATGAVLGFITAQRKVLLDTGGTVQVAMWADANADPGGDLNLRHFRMSVQELTDVVAP